MDLHVRIEGRRDLSRQVHGQLREAILDGRLRAGARLPPTRELARRLSLSRNTVAVAYEWLTAEGFLSARSGAGTFVSEGVRIEVRARRIANEPPPQPRPVWNALLREPFVPSAACAFDFGVGMPDARLFPHDTWRWLMARQLRPKTLLATYGDPAGHPRLRAAIAGHAGVARGVRTEVEDVLVTHGAQQALDLIGRVSIEPGATVAVEDPGYPPARLLFESLGAKVVHVPVDREGLDVSALPGDARLVYVTPSHQFPLGMPMSHRRRIALLDWAKRRDALLIEDDYDSEFRFGGRPLETLQALDRGARVIYVGSFSKVMLPSLRLGFLIAPPSLRRALHSAMQVSGWHAQWPAQGALAEFIEDGLFARHLRKMRREYSARHEKIQRTLERDFADWLEPIPTVTGMHLCAPLRISSVAIELAIARRAQELGVGFDRLSKFARQQPRRTGLVLGYGAIATKRIDEGLRRLKAAFAKFRRAGE